MAAQQQPGHTPVAPAPEEEPVAATGEQTQERDQHYQVWGQPSAWQDTVITTWIVEDTASHLKERHGTSQCLHLWDCLKAQWSEPVLHASWANQQITLPVMPDATAYLQNPDIHWNSPFKADLRHCKAEVQFQGEVAAMQQGDQYIANWGLAEIAQTKYQSSGSRN